MPGYVDTHAHLRARDGLHRTDVWPYLANLAYGVTTMRDPQTGNTEVLSYADMVRTGAVLGPRVYSTGPGVFWQDGIDTAEEARDAMQRYADYFDTKTIKMYVAAARKGRQHIIMAARELGLMPTTEGALNIRQNLTETIDGYPGLEHSIPIFPVYGDYVKLFAETGRVYTPTLLVSYGGPWAENWFYSRENPHDDEKLRRFVPHDEIDLGSIEGGKLADLVILSADPLEDLRNTNAIEQVMLNGRLYDADTLDEVYPRRRPLAPLWWWDDEPEGVPGIAP